MFYVLKFGFLKPKTNESSLILLTVIIFLGAQYISKRDNVISLSSSTHTQNRTFLVQNVKKKTQRKKKALKNKTSKKKRVRKQVPSIVSI